MSKNKDWTGNQTSIYKTLGASNHTEKDREENDFYATEPKAIDLLCEVEKFHEWILEPACGEGHLSKRLIENGYQVYSSDLIDRGYGMQFNFLETKSWHGDIIQTHLISLLRSLSKNRFQLFQMAIRWQCF